MTYEYLPGLDEYLERQAEQADEASWVVGKRPDAVRKEITFAELRAGDYMTAEAPGGRWVRVTNVAPMESGKLKISFETPSPAGLGGHTDWVIERNPDDTVTVDASTRDDA